jgi:hypothetical protein
MKPTAFLFNTQEAPSSYETAISSAQSRRHRRGRDSVFVENPTLDNTLSALKMSWRPAHQRPIRTNRLTDVAQRRLEIVRVLTGKSLVAGGQSVTIDFLDAFVVSVTLD